MDSDEVDYFSFLPDALILIIITFLPFREAVQTSILSRRWRNLWQSSRNIDLDQKFFVKNESPDEEKAMQKRNFVGFIRRWMENYTEPDVETFRLVMSNPPECYLPQLQECIRFAVNYRGVKKLDLDFSDQTWDEEHLDIIPQMSRHLPLNVDIAHAIFLESLKLSACDFRVPQSGRFSALKNVSLGWMEIPGASLNNFLSTCPSLEILVLKRCRNVGNLNIEAQRLRVLVLDKCLGPEYISVNAPFLRFFEYSGVLVYLQMEDHWRIEEAVFDFALQPEMGDEADAEMLYNLLSEIWAVRVLTICSYMLQVLPLAENVLKPRLASVRHLYLKTQLHIQEYYGITFFLNSCPMLEVLSIDLGPKRIFEDYRPPYHLEEHPFFSHFWYPTCLGNTLKTIYVIGFKGDQNELVALRYLLRYGRALEYLYIVLSKEREDNGIDMASTYRENVQRLLRFGVSSSHLQVYVSSG